MDHSGHILARQLCIETPRVAPAFNAETGIADPIADAVPSSRDGGVADEQDPGSHDAVAASSSPICPA